ncbi:hypothetical protein GLOTRDRAFT_90592 [Gloeophyllum trabeum ATCC 11539]|uniref:Uncharacterized protein n=1 Tax=Gloeophyllum trabeum (strain ATCC 11539 / FP-39264 / Madison 617) TaxID=670483 RepID=S7RZD7_GLOTA|nr:uncharacterized protein GLOTRDRAFT_90592 [Gloeophyllum trabeum ATCC 11539]EPQ58804.1 hypothetical protein GLOTRDRAFT_90592 [Gloeophyllum trabeum ATCC 11539]
MSTQPIPIIVTGKPQLVAHPDLPRRLFNGVKPKYEIAHFCFSAEAFADEFPKVMQGESFAVSGGVGTNVGSSNPRKPKAAVVGGGMTDEEFAQMSITECTSREHKTNSQLSAAVTCHRLVTNGPGFKGALDTCVEPSSFIYLPVPDEATSRAQEPVDEERLTEVDMHSHYVFHDYRHPSDGTGRRGLRRDVESFRLSYRKASQAFEDAGCATHSESSCRDTRPWGALLSPGLPALYMSGPDTPISDPLQALGQDNLSKPLPAWRPGAFVSFLVTTLLRGAARPRSEHRKSRTTVMVGVL